MIAVDTNILIYAHRKDSPWHDVAKKIVKQLAEARKLWTIPWPCAHEFLAIVTHFKIFNPPSTISQAIDQVEAWMQSPGLRMTAESDHYWDHLKNILLDGKLTGPLIHDMRIAAICQEAGVSELWTADRDFSRCRVKAINPLI